MQVPSTLAPSPSATSDSVSPPTRTRKGVPLRIGIGKDISADSTFKSLEQPPAAHDVFIPLPFLPTDVSRVEPLQQLCVLRIATIMAGWSGHEPSQQDPHVSATRISMLPMGLRERLLRTLTCRLTLNDYSLRPLLSASLRTLDLSQCGGVTDAALVDLLERCPALEKLSLAGLQLSEEVLLRFLRDAPSLDSINLLLVRGLNVGKLEAVISTRKYE